MTNPSSFNDQADNYLRALDWSDLATEHDKALVAGNIRNFATLISINSPMDCSSWDSRCVQLEQQLIKVQASYSELLHAVGKTYPGMSRHEIALQYIRNAEMPAQPPDPPQQERA